MQTAHEPAVLPFGIERAGGQAFPVPLHLAERQERAPFGIVDDRGYVVIEEDPLAVAMGTALEEGLE
jgi:hypothetical protein